TGRRSSSRRPSRLRRLQARLASRRLRGHSLVGANGAPREAGRLLAARSLRTWTLGGRNRGHEASRRIRAAAREPVGRRWYLFQGQPGAEAGVRTRRQSKASVDAGVLAKVIK